MAKGNVVRVIFDDGRSEAIEVKTGGRTLRVSTPTKAKVQWYQVDEVTRGGRPTGTRLLARMDKLSAVREYLTVAAPKPPKAKAAAKPGLRVVGTASEEAVLKSVNDTFARQLDETSELDV